MNINTSRRGFLQGAAAASAALIVGMNPNGGWAAGHSGDLIPNPFVKISADGTVTVIVKHFEMGQGTSTGLTTLVAEELDADWSTVAVEFAPADVTKYANTLLGVQGTGGSSAMANSYMQYREAGAAARALLVEAAAAEWGVPADEITISAGVVSHGDNSAGFGELVGKVPDGTMLDTAIVKDSADFNLIGNADLPRKDTLAKTNGTAIFAMDVMPEDVVYAVVLRSPKFGGKLTSFDGSAAEAMPGVIAVKQIPVGVAVIAENTWAAIQARDAVTAEWDFSEAETRSSDQMEADYLAALDGEGLSARNDGDVSAALETAANTIEVDFHLPFLAHAPMETLNCVLQMKDGKVQIWDGSQYPTVQQGAVGAITGVGAENVFIDTVYAGGSFGRRASFACDYQSEAAMVAVAMDDGRPIKLVWTREDDVKGGFYRPMTIHRVRAAVDADGNAVAWESKIANKSIFSSTPIAQFIVQEGVDPFSVEGTADSEYAIPNLKVDIHNMETQVPVLWWRAVGHSHTGYAMEVAMDMLAEAAGKDPVAFRETLLANAPRDLGVLQLAAEKANWGSELPEGWGRGIAVHKSFNTYVAHVAEVSVTDGRVKLERIVSAVDVGVAVNPDVIKAQVEGAVGYGLGHVMRQKITFTDGEVDQSNFPDYEPLRIYDMPKVETYIVQSTEAPSGIGEPGLPPAGPAVANAIYAATGKRVTRLPMVDDGISFA